jgi:uncharacterized protein YndB with AHSA1/START domain
MTPVRLQRTIAAPPDEVYRTWLDPDLIRRWMAPGDLEVTDVEVDERVGGAYRVWQGEGGGFDAEILELVPAERLVFRWGFAGPDRLDGPIYDSLLTITLREGPDGGTELTLVHERLEALRAALPDVADKVGVGWASALDKLATAAPPSAR